MRLVEYVDPESNKEFSFITNNLLLTAQSIADIYKARWQIELFFKWIKQHLRIKAFLGTSQNAITTQIWIAVCVYALLAITKKKLKLKHSLNSILQVLSISSTEKMPIFQAFSSQKDLTTIPCDLKQLNLFDIPTGQ